MSKVDWSKAPEWATCVVKRPGLKEDHHWSEKPINDAQLQHIKTGVTYTIENPNCWEIVEECPALATSINDERLNNDLRSVPLPPPLGENCRCTFTPAQQRKIDWSKAPEWATCVIMYNITGTLYFSEGIRNGTSVMRIHDGKAFKFNDSELQGWTVFEERPTLAASINDDRLANDLRSIPLPPPLDKNCRCTFTPAQQPSTAPELLKQAAQLLAERGQQYDKSGNERSAAKIVAAFNAVTGRDLTPGEGWLFLVMLKAVRFYSNTETPHRDSLEDMIAYAALHAEEYLNDK